MSKINDLQINSNSTNEKDKQAFSNKENASEDKSKKKVNFDNSFEQSVYDLSSSQYNNNNLNQKDKDDKSQQKKQNKDEEYRMKSSNDYKEINNDRKKNFDPDNQSQEFINIQNKYGEFDSIENLQEKLGSNSITATEINNNHYPTNRGVYYSKMDIAEKNYLNLMKKFEKLLIFDEKIEKLEEKRAFDEEIELLKKQNIKLIKKLEKMNDILDNVVDYTKLVLKNPNFLKGKKFEKNDRKKENNNKNSFSKSSQLTASIGDNRLVEVYKQDYLKYLKRYETVSQDNYINKVEENLFHINNEIESITKENKNLNYKQKSSEIKFELKNSMKLQNGINSDLSITSFDYNNQKKLLDEMNDRIDKNKYDIKTNEDKIVEWNLKYNKYKEIAGFYNISEEITSKTNSSNTKQKINKIEKFTLTNKMNILFNASNSMKKKYEQIILKNEKTVFHLKNVKIQTINYFKIKSAIQDELAKQVRQMFEIRKTYEDERFLRSLQEDDDTQFNYQMLNNDLRRSVDYYPMRNHNQRYIDQTYREKSNMDRRQYLPKEEIELIDSLDNAKKFVNEYQHYKNLKSVHSKEEPIEYENEEEFFKRMNDLKLNLSKVEKEKNEAENSIDEKLEKEIIEKYSKKTGKRSEENDLNQLENRTEINKGHLITEHDKKLVNSEVKETNDERVLKKEQENLKENNSKNNKEKDLIKVDKKNVNLDSNSKCDKNDFPNKEKPENYVKLDKDKTGFKDNFKDDKLVEKEEKKIESSIENKGKKNVLTGNLYREDKEKNKNENDEKTENKTKKKKSNQNDLDDLII
jgi:hypothetical protein